MKCYICKKNISLINFQCKCDLTKNFCTTHKNAEQHNCTFNYKKQQQEKIILENPVIQSAKIIKI
jgi:hypothetical protein